MVSVLIPYRGGCDYREKNLQWVLKRWRSLPVVDDIHVGDDATKGPWRKGAQISKLIGRCRRDVVIVADADVWAPGAGPALLEVYEGRLSWCMPYSWIARLSREGTSRVFAGEDMEDVVHRKDGLACSVSEQIVAGGMVVLTKDTYAKAPMDPRFAGWGHEDQAWGYALEAMAGPMQRVPGMLYHLWHPPAEKNPILTTRNRDLKLKYAKARTQPQLAQKLVEEGLQVLATGANFRT